LLLLLLLLLLPVMAQDVTELGLPLLQVAGVPQLTLHCTCLLLLVLP
jgi:hypothetical protein